MHGGDVELREAEFPRDVHGRHHRLMRAARIGANRDGPAIRAGLLLQGGAQGVGTGVDQGSLIDAVGALGGDGDDQRFARRPAVSACRSTAAAEP